MDEQSESKREKYLRKLHEFSSKSSLGLSRFFWLKEEEEQFKRDSLKGEERLQQLSVKCPYCGQDFTSQGQHHVRVKPRQRMTKKHQKLLQKFEKNPNSLGKYQKNCLQNFLNSKNTVAITCHTCSKTTFIPGSTRLFVKEDTPDNSASVNDEEAPVTQKSRKEKRKEKKKEKRKRKIKEKKIDSSLSVCSERSSSPKESTEAISKPEIVNSNKISSTVFGVPTDIQNMKKILQKNSGKCAKIGLENENKLMTGKKRNLTCDDKGLSKKKSKKKHQMLSKILEQDKSKDGESSLSAFLCSL